MARIRILKERYSAGKLNGPGDVIDVDDRTARRWIAKGICELENVDSDLTEESSELDDEESDVSE